MWEDFICNSNGASFFIPSHWVTSDVLFLYTDASGSLGVWGIFQTHWFQGSSEPHQQLGQPGISFAWQELFAFVAACRLWAHVFSNKRIRFFCVKESVHSTKIQTYEKLIPT